MSDSQLGIIPGLCRRIEQTHFGVGKFIQQSLRQRGVLAELTGPNVGHPLISSSFNYFWIFAAYPEAIDLAFGAHVKFGTIQKEYRNAQIIYTPSEMVGTIRRGVFGINEQEARSICTSHIERHNLTTRTFMKRFNRLTLGFSKKLENLAAATAMYVAYYNYCWRPRKPGKTGKRFPTPCMMAGITVKPWSFAELFERVTA